MTAGGVDEQHRQGTMSIMRVSQRRKRKKGEYSAKSGMRILSRSKSGTQFASGASSMGASMSAPSSTDGAVKVAPTVLENGGLVEEKPGSDDEGSYREVKEGDDMIILPPNSPLVFFWGCIMSFCFAWAVMVMPSRVMLDDTMLKKVDDLSAQEWITYVLQDVLIIDLFSFLDIQRRFRTAFFDNKMLAYVLAPDEIADNYYHNNFYFDAFASLPFDWILLAIAKLVPSLQITLYAVNILKLNRVLRAWSLIDYIDHIEEALKSTFNTEYFRLASDIIWILLVVHSVALVWWNIGFSGIMNGDESWILEVPDIRTPWSARAEGGYDGRGWDPQQTSIRYSHCLYWAATTMLTVGYGDSVPRSMRERYYTIFVSILGAIVNAIIFGSMATIIQVGWGGMG